MFKLSLLLFYLPVFVMSVWSCKLYKSTEIRNAIEFFSVYLNLNSGPTP
jgi:hypothetical protein